MADSSQIKATACFKKVTLGRGTRMQHHSSPWLFWCEDMKLKKTCVPRPAQQMSHKVLHEEISKCTGKVHLEHLETTVLCLHLSKGGGISVEFGWVWYSTLATETAVEKDHFLVLFDHFQSIYWLCVWKWSFRFLIHTTNWSSLPLWWKGKVRTGFCKLSLIIWNGTQDVQPSSSAQALCLSLYKYSIHITLPCEIKPAHERMCT